MENRPQGREKNVTGSGKGVGRRGNGLGTGPVGVPGGHSGRPTGGSGGSFGGGSGGGGRAPKRSGGGGGGMGKLLILLALLIGGGSGALGFLGDDTAEVPSYSQPGYSYSQPASSQQSGHGSWLGGGSQSSSQSGSQGSGSQGYDFSDFFSQIGGSSSSSAGASVSGWLNGSNTGKLDTSVNSAARAKYTKIRGSENDVATVMVYMCGTDLESQSGMGTKDLQEMVNAKLGSNVNLIVYTGGCRQWRNNIISSSTNQIYKIQDGGLICLEKNAGNASMTSAKTLTSFITYCTKNYPANRNMLILWDHGSGSITGYGYDEKFASSGAMSLKELDNALAASKTKFDFIGFDACLMGTLENALTMAPYADYLIASEETEPGLGWYYTNWLTALSNNTSVSTLELGKRIADDFVTACAQSARGQKTTLSVVDLAELEKTVPSDFKAFSAATLKLLKGNGYQTVSNARSTTREFASSNKTDQIDLVHLALKMETKEGRELAKTILSAIKYNRTSSNMTNAYGLALYFPYQKLSNVRSAVAAYNAIGMDSTYTDCISTFASMETGGQHAAGGSTSPLTALGGQTYGGSALSEQDLINMLNQLLGGDVGGLSFFDRSMDVRSTASYLTANRFDPDALVWTKGRDGYTLHLSERQWELVQSLELNVFVDDGEGYIDLGLDNTFDFTDDGDLIGAFDGTWLAIDSQNIAYYHTDTTVDGDHYTITGRVPVLLNGVRSDLILVFTDAEPNGFIAGARTDYRKGETETVAKAITELEPGDVIDFLCDYYAYDGTYLDSYMLGEQHIYTGREVISNVYLNAPAEATFRVTDLYNNSYWTQVIPG